MIVTSRGWGKTQQARDAYEAAKAQGEHAHFGNECSIDCNRTNRIRYPSPNRLGRAARRADVPGKESSVLG